jgi:Dyp-type peroxidase family
MALTENDLQNLPEDGIDFENPGKYQGLLADLQGNIIKASARDYSVHLFVQWKADKILEAKKWIKNFAETHITSAKKQAEEALLHKKGISSNVFANFLLTRQGYEILGFAAVTIPKDQPFTMGMKNQQIRESLGDPAISEWEEGYQDNIHTLLLIGDDDVIRLLQFINQITTSLRQVAVVLHREDGFLLKNKSGQVIEHFGFVDGVSQPLFTKRDIIKAKEADHDFNKWDPRSPLSLVLVKDPNGKTDDSYGSYLVYRKLEQNVKAFHEDKQKLAKQLNINEDLAGAFAVGRFPDGTPVTQSNVPASSTNNFNFDEDVEANKCPFHAHIRKTNPRGDTARKFNVSLQEEKGHQIVRRAFSYGDNNHDNKSETGSGLLFLCFQADIENQFNFMQVRWANADKFVQVGVGADPLIGKESIVSQKWPTQWGSNNTQEYNFKLWVKMKGGEYFFAPSISSLSGLV